MEAFELDSSDLWDLGRWFGWFLFECSLYLKLNFLKFLEASKLGSNRASGLLNLDLLQLFSLSPSSGSFPALLKCLKKASIYRGLGGRWATRGGVWLVTHVTAWLVRLCHRLHMLDCLCHCLQVRGCLCHRLHVRWCVIGFCMTLGKFLLASE